MTRILYLTPLAPLPTTDGGRQRTNLLYEALAKIGQVSTLVVNQTAHPISPELREELSASYGLLDVLKYQRIGSQWPWRLLGKMGEPSAHLIRGWGIDYEPIPLIRDRVARVVGEYDLVVSRYLWAPAISGVIGGSAPLIVDVDDRESEVVRSCMPSVLSGSSCPALKRWWWKRRVDQLALAEQRMLSQCSHFWLTKQMDLQGIDRLKNYSLLPNIPFYSPQESSVAFSRDMVPTLLFVGSLGFGPNRSGMQRFVEKSWPTVREVIPQARLRIVGGSTPQDWESIPGVEVLGVVPRLEEAYTESTISIVPLWEGAGTKIKVLEALQYARTVVATSYAMRGYEKHLRDGESVLVADNDQDLAQACIRLLMDTDLNRRLAEYGCGQVRAHYSRSVFERQVRKTVSSVLDPDRCEAHVSSV